MASVCHRLFSANISCRWSAPRPLLSSLLALLPPPLLLVASTVSCCSARRCRLWLARDDARTDIWRTDVLSAQTPIDDPDLLCVSPPWYRYRFREREGGRSMAAAFELLRPSASGLAFRRRSHNQPQGTRHRRLDVLLAAAVLAAFANACGTSPQPRSSAPPVTPQETFAARCRQDQGNISFTFWEGVLEAYEQNNAQHPEFTEANRADCLRRIHAVQAHACPWEVPRLNQMVQRDLRLDGTCAGKNRGSPS